jgi:hypothetical protein
MPPRTRATHSIPITPKHFWCMHCLRTALGTPTRPVQIVDAPFGINCVLDAKNSVMCRQCSARNATCLPVGFAKLSPVLLLTFSQAATAMLGDARDLSDVLAWAKEVFWDTMTLPDGTMGIWPYPLDVRLEVAEALVDLCRAFDGAEQAHRRENMLTGAKGVVKVSLLGPRVSAAFNRGFGSKPPVLTRSFSPLVVLCLVVFLSLVPVLPPQPGGPTARTSSCVCFLEMMVSFPGPRPNWPFTIGFRLRFVMLSRIT